MRVIEENPEVVTSLVDPREAVLNPSPPPSRTARTFRPVRAHGILRHHENHK